MVEYAEHLRKTCAVANNATENTIATGITAIAQQFSKSQKSMNAIVIHEIRVQLPVAWAGTDSISFSIATLPNTTGWTAAKKVGDPGVILADARGAGTAILDMPWNTLVYKFYPNELVTAPNLYIDIVTSDTGNVDVDIIYSIRQVSQAMFINALLPGQGT